MLQLYDSNTLFIQQKGRLMLTVPLFLIKFHDLLTFLKKQRQHFFRCHINVSSTFVAVDVLSSYLLYICKYFFIFNIFYFIFSLLKNRKQRQQRQQTFIIIVISTFSMLTFYENNINNNVNNVNAIHLN